MKIAKKLLALTAAVAMLTSSAYGQDPYQDQACCDNSCAYEDCGCASQMSTWIPIGVLVVAGVIIAATTRHGHHHHHNSSSSSSCHSH